MKKRTSNKIMSNPNKSPIKISLLTIMVFIGIQSSYCSSGRNRDSASPFPIDGFESLACIGRAGAGANGVDCAKKANWTLDSYYNLQSDIDISSTVKIGGRRDGAEGDCTPYSGSSGNTKPGDLGNAATCAGWTPVGHCGEDNECVDDPLTSQDETADNKPFKGTLDGNGFKITGLYINRPSTDNVGLFGYTNAASIHNVGVAAQIVIGQNSVSGLVGRMVGRKIINSYVTGDVRGTASNVGSLVGSIGWGSIENSYATANVTGSNRNVGGLVGIVYGGSVINSYARGGVTGSNNAGGLVGKMGNSMDIVSSIANSYATGAVTGSTNVGGLVGEMGDGVATVSSIANSYTTGAVMGSTNVGGLVGEMYTKSSIIGVHYYVDTDGNNGIGSGTCTNTICVQAMGIDDSSRQTWLQDNLDETTVLSWSADIWGNLGTSGSFPCLKGLTPGCP